MTVYDRIRERRKELHITQDELAKKAGYSNRSSISTIEKGKVDLSIDKVKDFAKALECTPGYLMGWSDEDNDERDALEREIESLSSDQKKKILQYIKFIKMEEGN